MNGMAHGKFGERGRAMKRLAALTAWAVLTTAFADEAVLLAKLPDIFARSVEHYKALDAEARPLVNTGKKAGTPVFPHGFKRAEGKLDMRDIYWWTSGHTPGTMWYLHEATGDETMKANAIYWTEILEPVKDYDGNHDTGFMMYCSYGNARRILKTDKFDKILLDTCASLCRRYDDDMGLIRSWGAIGDKKSFLVIPDNMMNLEMLEWAAKNGGGARFDRIARSHASVTDRHHFRADSGCYHVLNYDQKTKTVMEFRRGQGLGCETAWSRGQAWAIYGYSMMYRETGDAAYLERAVKCADFAINHPNMPADGVPYWDFGAPGEERDSSAGAITASGLLELSQVVAPAEKAKAYRAFAVKQLLTLSGDEYFSKGREIGHFLLKHGVGSKPSNSEIDTPLNYGDYYYIEALLRFRALAGK